MRFFSNSILRISNTFGKVSEKMDLLKWFFLNIEIFWKKDFFISMYPIKIENNRAEECIKSLSFFTFLTFMH